MAGANPQLPLALRHQPDFSRDSFMVGPSNAAAFGLIEAWPNWPARVIVLSGPEGSGKTHLARIWAERSGATVMESESLLRERNIPSASGCNLVMEDVDPQHVPDRALFHLVNSAKEAGTDLLITSRQPADAWLVQLPDLRSRLRMAAPAALLPPDEDLLRRALVKLFADRQLMVEKAVLDYLLNRMERSLAAAVTVVAAIDREALASRRPITRPLVGSVLALVAGAGEFTEPQ